MEMNIKKMDEGRALVATMNASYTAKQIRTLIDIPVSEEEIQYMMDHWKPDDVQINLIYAYYASYFGNFRDTNLITRHDFYELAIRLKKKLLIEHGWEIGEDGVIQSAILPYILTGNLEGKMNSRIIRNNKYMNKLEEDEHYTAVEQNVYSLLLEIHPDEIKSIVSKLVNSRFTYVTPEDPSLTGVEIDCAEDQIGSELAMFLNNHDTIGRVDYFMDMGQVGAAA